MLLSATQVPLHHLVVQTATNRNQGKRREFLLQAENITIIEEEKIAVLAVLPIHYKHLVHLYTLTT